MNRLLKACAGAVAIIAGAAFVQAEAFDPKQVSPEAAWVVHVDVDTLGKSNFWKTVEPMIQKNLKFSTKLAEFERVTDINVPADMHDILLYGSDFQGNNSVVIISSNAKQERLRTLVSLNETYKSQQVDGREVLSWDDKGSTMYGSFQGASRVVIGHDQGAVRRALDFLDGTKDGLKVDDTLATGKGTGLYLYVACNKLGELIKQDKAQLKLLGKLDHAWLSIGENPDSMLVTAFTVALDKKAAEQICTIVEGFRAMVNLAASDDDAEEGVKVASQMLQSLKVTLKDASVNMSMAIPNNLVEKLVQIKKESAEIGFPAGLKVEGRKATTNQR